MDQIKRTLKKILKQEDCTVDISKIILAEEKFIPISKTYDSDIFITGYPKSGNTWMQNLISGLLYGIETSLLPDSLTQELVPDIYEKKYYKRFLEFSFFKSHELPKPHMRRVIYLVRDGRDAMASYYAMNQSLGKEVSLDEMIVEGKEIYPSKWYFHIKEWLKNPYKAEILIVKFEDLINNPYDQLVRILDFSGLNRSQEIINRTISGNTFSEMKNKEKKFGWNNAKWDPNEKFIRRGIIGSYKDEISEDLIIYFQNEAKEELRYFNYL